MTARSIAIPGCIAALTLATALSAARAQQHAEVKRNVLQKHDLRAQGQEGVMATVDLPPGGREGKHTHPAEVFAYVVEGTLTLEVEGKPSATYSAGQSFFVEPGVVHEGANKSGAPVKVVAVFVTEKGKPMTTQVK
jgi:quercetin dioxygenase-like cupin family protein